MTQTKTEKHKPTPGALRAAKEIADIFADVIREQKLDAVATLAAIIDRETGAPELSETVNRELLAALECLEGDLRAIMPTELVKHFGASREKARAAIAKAKRESK